MELSLIYDGKSTYKSYIIQLFMPLTATFKSIYFLILEQMNIMMILAKSDNSPGKIEIRSSSLKLETLLEFFSPFFIPLIIS